MYPLSSTSSNHFQVARSCYWPNNDRSSKSSGPSFLTLFTSGEAGRTTKRSSGAGTKRRLSEIGSGSRQFIQSAEYRVNRVAPSLLYAVFCAEDSNDTNSRFDAPSHRTQRGQEKGSPAVSSKCWAGLQALPVPSKSSGGADSPRWTDRGHFKIIGASAPWRSRPMAVGSSACPLFPEFILS
jgi:hypothetical protein